MFVLASPIVDWNAMWKIFLVALVAGAGTVVAFGFLLVGLKLANRLGKGTHSEGSRIAGYALAGACAVICVAVVVIGVYAMTQKPPSTPAKPKAALVIPAGPRAKLIASSLTLRSRRPSVVAQAEWIVLDLGNHERNDPRH